MKVPYLRLAEEIADELKDIERVVVRTETIMEKAMTTGDDAYLDAVAINLHGFYSGLEQVFKNVARIVDRSMPDGDTWHQNLLHQMTLDIPSIRSPVISKETFRCLEEFLKFRHIVRNVYTFNFRGLRLQELTAALRPCFTAVSSDLTHFIQFLNQLATDDN